MSLVDELVEARERIEQRVAAAGGVGVRIVAVTKTHPVETVRAAISAGFTDLGENYAAEFAAKAGEVGGGAPGAATWRWHFIGQLQTNKVRVVAPFVGLYQSVDRRSLIAEIAKRSPGSSVMIQVNLADVQGRGGASFSDVGPLIESARQGGLNVCGLMGVAPVADHSTTATAFARLRRQCDAEALAECSMGMSGDLEIAVAEGSTMVRIGSAIFGSRG